MNAVLDGFAALLFLVAIGAALGGRGHLRDPMARAFLIAAASVYVFVGVSSLLAELGWTSALVRFEDYVEILFAPFFLFFVYAVRSRLELCRRRTAEADLARERDQLHVTLHSIADAVLATDEHGRVSLLNLAAETLTGFSAAEALGRPVSEIIKLVDERTRRAVDDPVSRVLASGDNVVILNHTSLIDKHGRPRFIEDSAAPIRDVDGVLRGAVLVFRDVSNRHATERELQKLQRLDSLGLLAGGIAHDFNNLLTAVLGSISLVRSGSSRGPEVLRDAESAALRARDLTRQLLAFARGGAPMKRPLSMNELVREATGFALRGGNVECDLQLGEPGGWVNGDEGQLSQVLHNLVLNAREAMPKGGRVTVRAALVGVEPADVSGLTAGRYVKLDVEDRGEGILPENVERIFDAYFTTKERGVGLGLATARSIIAQHDGIVRAHSVRGQGTTMSVWLPTLAAHELAGAAAASARTPLCGRVLVMDDESSVRDVTGYMLEHLGLRHESVLDGEAAVAAYAQALRVKDPFDVVILDLTVPGGTGGSEALAALRAIDPSVRAIVMSGYQGDSVLADHSRFGFSDRLLKPFRIEDLQSVLVPLLGAQRAM